MKIMQEGALLSASFFVVAAAPAQQPATLEIDAQKPIAHVSPTLYGLMTEEINHSYDGGLYPDLIRNRAFMDDSYGPHGWVLIEQGNARASMELDKSTGPSTAIPRSLKVTIQTADAKNQAGVANTGYWGMAVRGNETYQCSFYAKSDGGMTGPMTARLVSDRTGAVLAEGTVPAITGEWQQYNVALKAGAVPVVSAENHFELVARHAGKSLSEPGLRLSADLPRSPERLRHDLMEKMAAMHPEFLRLPGGNYLEGDHITERFEWKKTIGPLVDRPDAPSPWNYHSSDGMGLLEFLEWCEDLKMQPVLAVYAGYSHEAGACRAGPGPRALRSGCAGRDRVRHRRHRYEVGRRARQGRASRAVPADLRRDRQRGLVRPLRQLRRPLRAVLQGDQGASYPDLQLIATTPVKSVKPDVIDDHYYRRATEFFDDAHHYDKTDRNGPKIFVGEWATREGSADAQHGRGPGRCRMDDRHGAQQRLIVMASLRAAACERQPGRHAVGHGPDRLRRAERATARPATTRR